MFLFVGAVLTAVAAYYAYSAYTWAISDAEMADAAMTARVQMALLAAVPAAVLLVGAAILGVIDRPTPPSE